MQSCGFSCRLKQPYILQIQGAFQVNWVVSVNIKQSNGELIKEKMRKVGSQASELKLESSNPSFVSYCLWFCFCCLFFPHVKVTEVMVDLAIKRFASCYCGGMGDAAAAQE